MITLEQLLESRDARAAHQRELLEAHPGLSLVCLTVQLPGPVKRNEASLIIGGAGLAALLNQFKGSVRYAEVRDLETGYEAYLLLPLEDKLLKKTCCTLEDEHPLGRLMDMDVIGPQGPVSRADIGLEPRKCLLCGNEARFCMRARAHTTEQLLGCIDRMVKLWNTEN